jgi:hypothetical protein
MKTPTLSLLLNKVSLFTAAKRQESVFLASTTFLAAVFLLSQPVFAKQCVWNKGPFVLSVTWMAPPDFKEVKTDRIPYGRGSCTSGEAKDNIAALSIVGAKFADTVTKASLNSLVNLVRKLSQEVLDEDDAGKLKAQIQEALPEPKGVFWTGLPSRDGRYLDVWGTAWEPRVTEGGGTID